MNNMPMHNTPNPNDNSSVAVFIDVENIYYSTLNNYSESPDWALVLQLCKQYGRVVSIQAFGNWIDFAKDIPDLQKNGIQPIFSPLSQYGKSSLDSYLIVSAMKLFYQNNAIDTFILASGDRDYIPLIAELKALGKKVFILTVPETSSSDLAGIVDGVISYEHKRSNDDNMHIEESKDHMQERVVGILKDLEELSHHDRWVNLAVIGLALKRRMPSFSHTRYGYHKLVGLLDDIPEIEIKYNDDRTTGLARTQEVVVDQQDKDMRAQGTIYSVKEGYGFIQPSDNTETIFFHCSKLLNAHFQDLIIGDRVLYTTRITERGINAENITRIG